MQGGRKVKWSRPIIVDEKEGRRYNSIDFHLSSLNSQR